MAVRAGAATDCRICPFVYTPRPRGLPCINSTGQPDADRAAVAQLDRASGFEPEGRGFESLRPRHATKNGGFRPDRTWERPRAQRPGSSSAFLPEAPKITNRRRAASRTASISSRHRSQKISISGASRPQLIVRQTRMCVAWAASMVEGSVRNVLSIAVLLVRVRRQYR